MKLTTNFERSALLALALSAASTGFADSNSPWTLAEGTGELGFRYGQQTADRFFVGGAEMPLPADLEQSNVTVDFSYGLNDNLSLDVQLGYANSDFPVNPVLSPKGGLSGLQDSRLGIRYKFFGGVDQLPALSVGVAAIIAGNYDTGAISAIGDGASGFEAQFLAGHAFDSGLVLQGSVARREYSEQVPSQTVLNLGAGYGFTERFSGGVFYQNLRANGNLDIGGPGFSPAVFPELDEDYALFGASLGLSLTESWAATLDFGRKHNGRNTAKSRFFQIGVNYYF